MLKKVRVVAAAIAILLGIAYVLVVAISPAESILPPDNKLVVDGLVENPIEITYDELLSMPSVTVTAALICVQNQEGIGAEPVEWTGVQLKTILELADYAPNAVKVAFYAKDGFSTDLDIETALMPDILVAYRENGKTITGFVTGGEGSPTLRLVVPGKWGYKWIVWLNRIQVVDYNYLGKWESNGYSDEADIPFL